MPASVRMRRKCKRGVLDGEIWWSRSDIASRLIFKLQKEGSWIPFPVCRRRNRVTHSISHLLLSQFLFLYRRYRLTRQVLYGDYWRWNEMERSNDEREETPMVLQCGIFLGVRLSYTPAERLNFTLSFYLPTPLLSLYLSVRICIWLYYVVIVDRG